MGADGAVLGSFERIGILGAGAMGAGVAQVVAEAGIDASLYDPEPGAYERAHQRAAGYLARKVEKGQIDEETA
ncbi:MAG: 3-hydroxyacyl-CoA dehydrogenase NAD-binding domain-containing protein, partial [Candidatus Limnocylindria bacterium]